MKFKIPVTYTMWASMEVNCDSIQEAIALVNAPETPLPIEVSEYLDESFSVDFESLWETYPEEMANNMEVNVSDF